MTRKLFAIALLVVALGSGFYAGRASAVQNHMVNARNHLNLAKEQLEAAAEDKGGHRVAALKLVNDAIGEVNAGINFANRH
jgi:hypothetical protein